jgi:hypothetical protein
MKVENMPRNPQKELQELICKECQGTVWNVKGKCAHPEIKNEHPNPNLDNRCLRNS